MRMDRAHALAVLNGKILAAYSSRTIDSLRASAPLRVALPYIEPVLALNVGKEIRKDALVIEHAAAAAANGEPPPRANVAELFARTRAIDEDFVARTGALPVRVVIRYDEIEPVRTKRIRYILDAAYRICRAWERPPRLRDAIRTAYERSDFELVFCVILDLYAQETRALSRSVQLPSLLAPLRERAAKHLATVMSQAASRLTADVARGLYRF
jgi:hypothetical protein